MGYYVSHVLERKDSNGGIAEHEDIDMQENYKKPVPNAIIKPLARPQEDDIAIN